MKKLVAIYNNSSGVIDKRNKISKLKNQYFKGEKHRESPEIHLHTKNRVRYSQSD
jgi:hypothetical protein